jgi:tRNA-splicing ligase RtcB
MTNATEPVPGVKAWVHGVQFEQSARTQVEKMSRLPFIFKHIAIMSDVHWGNGACVGSVIPTKSAIIPAAVGVDLGCGMNAVKTNLHAEDLPDTMREVRYEIERAVPVGGPGEKGSWREAGRHGAPARVATAWTAMEERYRAIVRKHPKVEATSVAQLGTLGSGNHFIEVCLDEMNGVWVMLHSGSRGLGNRIGSYFIEKAKEEMREHHINLPDVELAYLRTGTQSFDDYYEAITFAQDFAAVNRKIMMDRTIEAFGRAIGRDVLMDRNSSAISCHHNYASKETHFGEEIFVTRKGAVSAKKDQLGIIPGSMGAKSFIVRGLGNPDSFTSCSHGAGRAMSRGEAKRTITLEEHIKDTEGVECLKDASVLDESPRAYKDIDAVMAAQSDLVSIEATLKQILCVKGYGDGGRKRRGHS